MTKIRSKEVGSFHFVAAKFTMMMMLLPSFTACSWYLALSTSLIMSAKADTALNKPFSNSFAQLAHAPCTSLFTRNGRLGCSTPDRSLQSGKIVYFQGSLLNSNEDYVMVMEEYHVTKQNMAILAQGVSSNLQGILILNSTNYMQNADSNDSHIYSPEAQSPNGYNTPSANINDDNYQWNANGQGILQNDYFGLPMVYVVDSDVSDSLRQQSMSQQEKDDIRADFNFYMGPEEINSIECLAWKDVSNNEWSPKCLPLGGASVWAMGGSTPNANNDNSNKNVIIVSASMDSTSLFHDIVPAANTAASNILTVLLASKLVGENLNSGTLDNLSKKIVFALFQGESYGFMGSRSFFNDVIGEFSCNSAPVRSVYKNNKSEYACLNPLRHDLTFKEIGEISGMISVDQLAHSATDNILYVHANQNNDNYGKFLYNVLKSSSTDSFTVAAASNEQGQNGYSFPPSPMTSLQSITGQAVGGVVLTGYDYAFSNQVPYHSHVDSAYIHEPNYESIASAATLVARAAVAAAYDNGNYNYNQASAYASNLIPELDAEDADFLELADCFFYNGQCKLLQKYASVELSNQRSRTGLNLQVYQSFGQLPNYYVGVYDARYGQPFVSVGDNAYGAYSGYEYGSKSSDAFAIQPSLLESAIHGLLNGYLGQNNDDKVKCHIESDCGKVDYCGGNDGSWATCTGAGYCVCKRAHYHIAVDEAIQPAVDKAPGFFEVRDNDAGLSAIWTEPFWSSDIGVSVYRDVGPLPGLATLGAGLVVGAVSLFSAYVLRIGLRKEKLY